MAKQVFISTGDPSGDYHAANLVSGLSHTEIEFAAMGSQKLADAGAKLIVDSNDLTAIGLAAVGTLYKIYRAFKTVKAYLKKNPPDLLILIDYSVFNLRLAKAAKQLGIKTLYYISPQIWASRKGRLKKIKKYVDLMAVFFPFEARLYQQAGIPVVFVGNPLAKQVAATISRDEAMAEFGFAPDKPVVALLPGSRKGEIKHMLPTIIEAAKKIKQQNPDMQFAMPVASNLSSDYLDPYFANCDIEIKRISNRNYDVLQCCQAAVCVSGTITLEVALLGIPMVIIYKADPVTFRLALQIIQISHIGLCNIVAGRRIVQELLQHEASSQNIADEILYLLNTPHYRNAMIAELNQIKQSLDADSAKHDIATVVEDLLADKPVADIVGCE